MKPAGVLLPLSIPRDQWESVSVDFILRFQRLSVGTLPLSLAESVEESQHVEDWAELTDPVPGLLGVQPFAVELTLQFQC